MEAALVPVALVEAVTAEQAMAVAIMPVALPAPLARLDLAATPEVKPETDRERIAEEVQEAANLETRPPWLGRLAPCMAPEARAPVQAQVQTEQPAQVPAGTSSADQAVVAAFLSIPTRADSG